MGLDWFHPLVLGVWAASVACALIWLLGREQAVCYICGIPQGRSTFSKYIRLVFRGSWACRNCSRQFGWWGRLHEHEPGA